MRKLIYTAFYTIYFSTMTMAQVAVDLGNQVNTPYENYFPCLSVDQETLFFTVRGQLSENYSNNREQVYYTRRSEDQWSQSVPLILLDDHNDQGAVSLSADGNYLFFVVSNKKGDYGSADIYYRYKNKSNEWSSPIQLDSTINSPYWESSPSISPDLKTLYFSSNRPKGYGKKDLWQSSVIRQSDRSLKFEKPSNMGPKINTSGDELSPFIHPDNKSFYFSSDGHGGKGGLDVFKLSKDTMGTWGEVENMGDSINTEQEEVGFIVSSDGKKAYFSSKRWSDNKRLFSIELPPHLQAEAISCIKGKVYDAITKKPIEAIISINSVENPQDVLLTTSISSTGDYFLFLRAKGQVVLGARKTGYLFSSNYLQLDTMRITGHKKDIYLYPIRQGERLVLNNINFAHNKYELLASSYIELSFLLNMMNENPEIKIELGGFTDNVGEEEYNKQLSLQRANAVLDYLHKKGISKSRMQAIGYGEKDPIGNNDTELGRTQNRRTEIKIR